MRLSCAANYPTVLLRDLLCQVAKPYEGCCLLLTVATNLAETRELLVAPVVVRA